MQYKNIILNLLKYSSTKISNCRVKLWITFFCVKIFFSKDPHLPTCSHKISLSLPPLPFSHSPLCISLYNTLLTPSPKSQLTHSLSLSSLILFLFLSVSLTLFLSLSLSLSLSLCLLHTKFGSHIKNLTDNFFLHFITST